ncbi:MAG: GatB/YqeY domain-containing protein, partial [Thermoanaerobaculia bacterium]|nr:GatB/YqeY domain-containing protein [Thermoanaerobaculia bacterium]
MATTPIDRVQSDLKDAMKSGDKTRVSTLRMLLSELKNERIEKGRELEESDFLTVVNRGVKQRSEAATQYREGGREELAVQEETELSILQEYLPEPISEEEARAAVRDLIEEENLQGPGDMGRVMGTLM